MGHHNSIITLNRRCFASFTILFKKIFGRHMSFYGTTDTLFWTSGPAWQLVAVPHMHASAKVGCPIEELVADGLLLLFLHWQR